MNRTKRQKSLFGRLFISIMAITFVILLVQMSVVALMYIHQANQFKKEVFSSYAKRLQNSIDVMARSGGVWTLDIIGEVLKMAADDRISGLLVRDAEGNTILTFGKTPYGSTLPEPDEEVQNYETELMRDDLWYIRPRISQLYVQIGPQTTIRTVVLPGYPEAVRKQDIVGTVNLYADEQHTNIIGSVDVLAFSPFTYQMTGLLIKRMLYAFVITIPIALIIALVGSRLVARSASRNAAQLSHTLEAVANGNYQQPVPIFEMKELVQISESVKRMQGQLSSFERMRQQWFRNIAHDLNTPVTALKISIEGALDGVFPLDRSLIERLKRENDELERRVAAVMTLSAMEAPDFQMHIETIDVKEFAQEVIDSSLAGHHIIFESELEHMKGDRRLLAIACRELIQNANKYSLAQGNIHWRISKAQEPQSVCMEISNQGNIDAESLKRVFEPWYRADNSRSQGGSGLGLTIVQQVAQVHGGTASIEQRGNLVVSVLSW